MKNQDIEEFKAILAQFTIKGRQRLFDRLDEIIIMGDTCNIMETFFEEILKCLFDTVKDEDPTHVKE